MKKLCSFFIPIFFVGFVKAQNVGIGTLSPTSKLDVNGQITIDQKNFGGLGGLLIKGDAPGSNHPNICFSIKNNAATPADAIAGAIGGTIKSNTVGGESMDLNFSTSANGEAGLTERLRIKSNGDLYIIGNVGIGEIKPQCPLNFATIVGDKISLYGNSPGAGNYGFGIQSGLMQIHSFTVADDIAFGYGSSINFTETMRIKGNGLVGIGTSSPDASAQLDVSSTTKGFLPPRMTYAQRNSIVNPVAGLVVYCIDCDELQLYNGIIWKNMNGTAAAPASGFPTVTICSQVWMGKNLAVSNYRNGEIIPQVTDSTWSGLTTGAWCWYDNDSATNGATYGKLYNWYAVNDPRGLAPQGWHIPTDSEWTALSTCLGGNGGAMKETGTAHWASPNTGATNSSGFTGLPGGSRNSIGTYVNIGYYGNWWSSTAYDASNAWYRYLKYTTANVYRSNYSKTAGFSVRCVRD